MSMYFTADNKVPFCLGLKHVALHVTIAVFPMHPLADSGHLDRFHSLTLVIMAVFGVFSLAAGFISCAFYLEVHWMRGFYGSSNFNLTKTFRTVLQNDCATLVSM